VPAIDRIGIVVPAKNEQRLLPACLAALRVAARQVNVPVTVVVVLDACSDHSAAIVQAAGAGRSDVTIEGFAIEASSVGAARRAGMRTLLDRHGSHGLWLATTDADSVVPPRWLRAQLAHAVAGARVVVGTITVTDWEARPQAVRRRAIAEYTATHHRHVHGANLSFSAAAYVAAGGFPPQPFDEDVDLVRAYGAAGEPIAWAVELPVTTSARRNSRSPLGFARYLDRLDTAEFGKSWNVALATDVDLDESTGPAVVGAGACISRSDRSIAVLESDS
jgi:glycosyltransferase involved in cell wall biosynthesis